MLRDVLLPELGLGDIPLVAGDWHVKHGEVVIQGDALVEIKAGGVVIDVPAPWSGKLRRRCVLCDESLRPGQRLAVIFCDEDDPA